MLDGKKEIANVFVSEIWIWDLMITKEIANVFVSGIWIWDLMITNHFIDH